MFLFGFSTSAVGNLQIAEHRLGYGVTVDLCAVV